MKHCKQDMQMTKEAPKEPGAYWFMNIDYDEKPHVVNVRIYGGGLAIGNWVFPQSDKYLWSEKIAEPKWK